MLYSHKDIQFNTENQNLQFILSIMFVNESHKHNIKQKQQDAKEYMLYESIYINVKIKMLRL